MGEAASERVVILGAGRVATHLVPAVIGAGYELAQVWSRTEASACAVAKPLNVCYTDDLDAVVTDADIYIVSVADSVLAEVAGRLVRRVGDRHLFLHTAGSVPMEVWRKAGAAHYGILYPLQTFSKERAVDMRAVSLFVEASDEESMARIEALARGVSGKVFRADSERRAKLHIAAVFACNFANAMYDAAQRLLDADGIPFEVLLPLIDETAAKVHELAPREAQTGPAVRGDRGVMKRHTEALSGEKDLQHLYEVISDYISKNKHKE